MEATAVDPISNYRASVVRIVDGHDRIQGAGFWLDERRVISCAHVVNLALGRPDTQRTRPMDQVRVLLTPPGGLLMRPEVVAGRIVLWDWRDAEGRDVAGLMLDGRVPSHGRVPTSTANDVWGHKFRVLGFPEGSDGGKWATGRLLAQQLAGWVQLEGLEETGGRVEPGYSGSPVLDDENHAVIGIVVAADRAPKEKVGYIIPCSTLASLWPGAFPVEGGSGTPEVRLDQPARGLRVSSTGTLLAAVSTGGVSVWDSRVGAQAHRFPVDQKVPAELPESFAWPNPDLDFPAPVAFSADDKLVAAGIGDGLIVWDLDSGTETQHLRIATHRVSNPPPPPPIEPSALAQIQLVPIVFLLMPAADVKFSPDGTLLATAHWDDTARVWDISTGVEIARLVHDIPLEAVFGEFRGWKTPASHYGTIGPVQSVAWSPDGKRLGTLAMGEVAIWDLGSLERVMRKSLPEGLDSDQAELSFTREGEGLLLIVQGHGSATAMGLDVQGNQWFRATTGPASAIAISQQRDGFLVGDAYGVIRVWNLSHDEWVVATNRGGLSKIAANGIGGLVALATEEGRLMWFPSE